MGLRRSGRKLRLSDLLKESDPVDTGSKEITKKRESYGLLIVATEVKLVCVKEMVAAYHTFLQGYDNF